MVGWGDGLAVDLHFQGNICQSGVRKVFKNTPTRIESTFVLHKNEDFLEEMQRFAILYKQVFSSKQTWVIKDDLKLKPIYTFISIWFFPQKRP